MAARGIKKTPYRKIKLVGERLELRPYRFSDFKALRQSHAGRMKPANKYDRPIQTSKESDFEKYKKRLRRHRKKAKDEHLFVFGAFDRKSGAYIGQIDLFTINNQLRWANIGYHIQNQHFGNGFATEAARLGLKAGFSLIGFYRIEAAMELDNKVSQKVAINIGLKFEGKRLKFFPDKCGIDMKTVCD